MGYGRAFTLVEILVVVVILAILAAVVMPGFSNVSNRSREAMLADDLRVLRGQVQVFTAQHQDCPPGYPDGDPAGVPTEQAFVLHMTQSSNPDGQTAAPNTPGFPYGPYFREIPPNPFNGKSSVDVILNGQAFPAGGDGSHGWIYQPETLTIRADTPGADDSGKSYFEY